MQKKEKKKKTLCFNLDQFGLLNNRKESVWMEETHIYTLPSSIMSEYERSTTTH